MVLKQILGMSVLHFTKRVWFSLQQCIESSACVGGLQALLFSLC